MGILPFVVRSARPLAVPEETPGRDVSTSEDPFPAVLGIDAAGYMLARQTSRTLVARETMDDV